MKKSSAFRMSPALIVSLILSAVLVCVFWKAFLLSDYVVFSNDGPLGLQEAAFLRLPQAFQGQWFDLQSIGANSGAALPGVSSLIKWVLGPVGYAKFLIPISLWFLGTAAYFCFRRCGLSAMASVLGGLAAALTTNYFSNACWGAAPPIIAFGMDFLAIGALAKRDKTPFWVAPALAGLAVGINVMEAADIGALFSVLVAAFVMYESLTGEGPSIRRRAARGAGRVLIVTIFAVFIAAYAVSALIGTAISGISGIKQDEQTKAAHWDFATEWSLPKHETLALAVPNLFGCSIITPGAANYWGEIGRDPSWDRYFAAGEQGPIPGTFIRHTGRGIYIGVIVVFIAFWAALQSLRGKDSVFSAAERRLLWFWCVTAIVSLLLAWGRWAWFYRILYDYVPYFSTVRNPDKFIHIITFAILILFAYGVEGLYRRYLAVQLTVTPGGRLKSWWSRTAAFDKRWVIGNVLVICVILIGWIVYAHHRGQVEDYLVKLERLQSHNSPQFDPKGAHAFAESQVSLSLQQVGWCVLFLSAASGLLVAIFSGVFAGRRAVFAGILLSALVMGDLVHANLPYIQFWNYTAKYEVGSTEPIIKFLDAKPYEQRAGYTLAAPPFPPGIAPAPFAPFDNLYTIEWAQQLFFFYNIQTCDIIQMPRMPEDVAAFKAALAFGYKSDDQGNVMLDDKTFYRLGRYWELTATRYVVGPAPLLSTMNQSFNATPDCFRIIKRFNLGPREGITTATQYSELAAEPTDDTNALYALFEFTAALPRASLFSNWQVNTNDNSTLQELTSPSFDPAKTVLLPKQLPVAANQKNTNQNPGSVQITSYEPADIKLEAAPGSPCILMLADKYDPAWEVTVDGKRGEVLKCDFLMRGVYLEPGKHEVEFRFRPNVNMLYVNFAAIVVGACLLGYAMFANRKETSETHNRDANAELPTARSGGPKMSKAR